MSFIPSCDTFYVRIASTGDYSPAKQLLAPYAHMLFAQPHLSCQALERFTLPHCLLWRQELTLAKLFANEISCL